MNFTYIAALFNDFSFGNEPLIDSGIPFIAELTSPFGLALGTSTKV